MQTIRITTSQNIDIDYEVAGLGERILASLIDYAILIASFLAVIIINSINGGKIRDFASIVIFIVLAVIYVFYDLACEIIFNGQSIGKRVMKIKVISIDGGQPSIGQYLLRWLFRIVDFSMTAAACAVITTAITSNNQRLGDLVAGTTLIRTSPRTQMDAVAFTPVNHHYVPVFTEATQLKDKDIALLHEVISSYIKSGNMTVVYNTAVKLKQVLGIVNKFTKIGPNNTYFKRYLLITAAVVIILNYAFKIWGHYNGYTSSVAAVR